MRQVHEPIGTALSHSDLFHDRDDKNCSAFSNRHIGDHRNAAIRALILLRVGENYFDTK